MQLALPRPNIAVPLATLVIGAAGGAALVAVLNDDEVVRLPSIAPSAQVQSESPGDVSRTFDPKLHPNKLGARAATGTVATESRPFTLNRSVSPEATIKQNTAPYILNRSVSPEASIKQNSAPYTLDRSVSPEAPIKQNSAPYTLDRPVSPESEGQQSDQPATSPSRGNGFGARP
jgi:hypothetical protein